MTKILKNLAETLRLTNSEKTVSLTPEQIQAAREWLLKHTYEEEDE